MYKYYFQFLVLGFNQSNEEETKIAIERYVEGTLVSKFPLYLL